MSDYTTDEVETLLKSEGRRQKRERLGVVVMVAGVVTGGLSVALGDSGAVAEQSLRYGWWATAILIFSGLIMALFWKRGRAARRLDTLIGRRDRLQRGRNDRIYATSVTGWMMVAICLPSLWRIVQGQADDHDLGFVAASVLSPWLVVMSVAGWSGLARLNRRWLEDEVTRDIRQRSMSLGFIVLMAALTALFIGSLWERAWAMMAIPAALMAAASATGLRFVWLDQQAEGGDGG